MTESRIFRSKIYLDDIMTTEFLYRCKSVKVPPKRLNKNTLDLIFQEIQNMANLNDFQMIYQINKNYPVLPNIKSHLAVIFGKTLTNISRITSHENYKSSKGGRPARFTPEIEMQIVDYVRERQMCGNCPTACDLTDWINQNYVSTDEIPISNAWVMENKTINEHLQLILPKEVEKDRIDACDFEHFDAYFQRLELLRWAYPYDPDLIINMDETNNSSSKSKKKEKVFYDPKISVEPLVGTEKLTSHISVVCSIAASGEHLTPVFIIKNKTATHEADLYNPLFRVEDYGLVYSPEGWQNGVSSKICIIILKFFILSCILGNFQILD